MGIGLLRGTTTPKTSPCMATPRDRGAVELCYQFQRNGTRVKYSYFDVPTSRRRRSAVRSEVCPVKTAAWTAAP